ncbi:hypothetical protein HDU77_002682 [Chytriomyces hyalinus]|nr:hypothetical protein HDU77_002682 [Chytriomyces hyalinus]
MSTAGSGIGPMTTLDNGNIDSPLVNPESPDTRSIGVLPLQNDTSPSVPSVNSINIAQPEGQQVLNSTEISVRGTGTLATGTLIATGTQTGTALASATVFETDGPLFGSIATEVSKTGAIVGSLIGVIAVLGLVAGFLVYRGKYMNKNRPKTDSERETLEVSDQFLPSPATVQREFPLLSWMDVMEIKILKSKF